MVKVLFKDKEYEVDRGTPYIELARKFQDEFKDDIILALVDGRLVELAKTIEKDVCLDFITTGTNIGIECYKRSVTFMMLKAVYKIVGGSNIEKVSVNFSLSKGVFCTIHSDVEVTEELLDKVKEMMHKLQERDIVLRKFSVPTREAITIFDEVGMKDKVNLFKYRRSSSVNIYDMDGFLDYNYGYMAYSTGMLDTFDLVKYEDGFVLLMPESDNPKKMPKFEKEITHYSALADSAKWAEMMGVPTIGQLNNKIVDGSITNVMMVQEAFQEKKIADIAEDIASRENVKIVLVAGPSSSGKTSFANRLSVQLFGQGLKPKPISVDNYFVNRVDNPLDEDGKPDYELLEALDIKKFNDDMLGLLNGEEVELPVYNFDLGERELVGQKMKLEEDEILIIEGIHCLNDALTEKLPVSNKYKIYVSALTPLRIDEHNKISTSDMRLLRRIVRDSRTRGKDAQATMEMWYRVRRGEAKNIYPYQDTADAVFNSALVYEPAVLKVYAEPALFGVPKDCPEYLEATRLLKFLGYVLPLPEDDVPKNSLVREFVGGSSIIKE